MNGAETKKREGNMKLILGSREFEITAYNMQTNRVTVVYRVNGRVMFRKTLWCNTDRKGGSYFRLGADKFYLSEFVRV
jgi:hypothetical protein